MAAERQAIRTLYRRFPKQLINSLPVVSYGGRIITVNTADEAREAVDFLLTQPLLGMDTETRPSFRRGEHHQVALLQVAAQNVCFLFRLNLTGITPDIVRLLEDTTVDKVGLSWHDDMLQLTHAASFKPGRFIDLQKHIGELGVEDMSLQKLFANFFGQKISKSQRLTNWEADLLQDKQKQYAAIDAWACTELWKEFLHLKATGNFIITDDDTQDIT
jgi:ribonuclease D